MTISEQQDDESAFELVYDINGRRYFERFATADAMQWAAGVVFGNGGQVLGSRTLTP